MQAASYVVSEVNKVNDEIKRVRDNIVHIDFTPKKPILEKKAYVWEKTNLEIQKWLAAGLFKESLLSKVVNSIKTWTIKELKVFLNEFGAMNEEGKTLGDLYLEIMKLEEASYFKEKADNTAMIAAFYKIAKTYLGFYYS